MQIWVRQTRWSLGDQGRNNGDADTDTDTLNTKQTYVRK